MTMDGDICFSKKRFLLELRSLFFIRTASKKTFLIRTDPMKTLCCWTVSENRSFHDRKLVVSHYFCRRTFPTVDSRTDSSGSSESNRLFQVSEFDESIGYRQGEKSIDGDHLKQWSVENGDAHVSLVPFSSPQVFGCKQYRYTEQIWCFLCQSGYQNLLRKESNARCSWSQFAPNVSELFPLYF